MKKDILRKSLAVAAALTVFLSASAYTALGSISAKAYTNADKANFDVTEKSRSIALTYKGTGREVTIPPYYTEYGWKGAVDHVTFNLDHDIELTIPSGFMDLPSMTFPDSSESHVKKISITSIGITELSNGCFIPFTGVESVELPPNLTFIPKEAFCGCSNLKTITIPISVRSIRGTKVFEECTSLETVYYEGTERDFHYIIMEPSIEIFLSSKVQYLYPSDENSEAPAESSVDSDGYYESQPSDNSEGRVTSWIETETKIPESTPDNTVLIVVFSVIGGFLVLGAAAAVVIIIAVKKKRQ